MFVLSLNDMRSSKIEHKEFIGWAETAEPLERLLAEEKVEEYEDGQWRKSFRKDGPLEWYNTPFESYGQGVKEMDLEKRLAEIDIYYQNAIAHTKEDYANFKDKYKQFS